MLGKHDLALLGGEPLIRHTRQGTWPPITEDDVQHVADMMRRGELSYYGREGEVRELEDKFAKYVGCRHALATTSGTAALHSAYFALGLRPGDEVLAPTYTFLATVMPLFVANAVPVLVDADLHTGNVDPVDLERRITARTRAIVVTHLWGNPVDMISMMEIARRHNLKVVEDCSHAHGATCDGKMVGSFGDVGIFSLQGKKLVAAGQGGILVTNDRNAFERAVLLGHFNVRSFQDVHDPVYRRYAETGLGLNYRMHPLAAAIANRQMDRLEGYIAGRRHNLEYLSKGLVEIPGIQPPVSRPHVTRQVYYSYKPTFCSEQLGDLPIDLFVEAVAAEGVPIERYRMTPLHTQPIFTDEQPPLRTHGVPEDFARTSERRRYRPGDLPNSEDYASRLLSMSVYTEPADHVINEIIAAFEKVVEHLDELHDLAASRAIPSTGSPQGRRPPLA